MSVVDACAVDDAPAHEGYASDGCDDGGDGEGDDSNDEGDPTLTRALDEIDDAADDFDDEEELVNGENTTPLTRRQDRKHFKPDYLLSAEQGKYLSAVFSEHNLERRESQQKSLSRTVSFSRNGFHPQARALGHSTIKPRTCEAERAYTAPSPHAAKAR
jgi:hypothetical protein